MENIFTRLLGKIGLVPKSKYSQLDADLRRWKSGFVQPGHYYSPLNDLSQLEKEKENLFDKSGSEVADIDFNLRGQEELLKKFASYYKQLGFPVEADNSYRYYYNNNLFSYSDAIFLYSFLQEFKPNKVIEVGSGFSSAVMLDTNERFLNSSVGLTFIEPYPEERLNKLLRQNDHATVIKDFVQNVDPALFRELGANDILFIDSSHVSKFNSDLNHIVFKILPDLQKGVIIHFHDIFYPFEYPKEWILSGRAWNEAYILRAFLMNNRSYEVLLFPSMLEVSHETYLQQEMPMVLKLHEKWPDEENFSYYLPNKGQSLWLRKINDK